MADIELVIKIPERIRVAILNGEYCGILDDRIYNAIKDGTPLPKEHGRLIILSEDAVKREQTPLSFSCQNWISEAGLSNATVAIIEAERSEEK